MAYQFSMRSSVRRRSQKCVSTVGQEGTELHVDTHGQHSLKCVFTLGQDGTELHVDAHRSVCSLWVKTAQNCTSALTVNTHRSVCPLWVKTAQNCTSTLTVNTHRSVCVHCGSRRHRIARRRSRSTLTEVCVSTVGQDGMHMAGSTHETFGKQARQCQITGGFKQSGPHQSGQQYV